MGHESPMRWNNHEKWIFSDNIVHISQLDAAAADGRIRADVGAEDLLHAIAGCARPFTVTGSSADVGWPRCCWTDCATAGQR